MLFVKSPSAKIKKSTRIGGDMRFRIKVMRAVAAIIKNCLLCCDEHVGGTAQMD